MNKCFNQCFNLVPTCNGNYMCDNCDKLFIFQPERLNPEDHVCYDSNMISDSLNCMETCRERSEEVSPPTDEVGHEK